MLKVSLRNEYYDSSVMARIHQNGHRTRAGKVGQLPHIIYIIAELFRSA